MKRKRLDKFSIRKLTVGAASVLVGVAFGATTVSAAAKPSVPQDTPASQQAAEVTALKDVKFTFKMGDKSATTRAVTIYATKDGHYGFTKGKCTYTAADITVAFLEEVSDSTIKSAQGIAYPEKIVAGENTVELAAQHASNPVQHSDADLQKEAEEKADELQNQFAEEAKKAALEAAKKAAHKALNDAGITGAIFHKAIDNATTVESVKAYVAETLAAHKTVEPVTPTPAPVVSGETGIGYLNLDMLSDGFTGTLYVPVVGKDVNCKVRLLDDAGKYTNDYVVTDTTVKALASKVVNGVTFYKVAENRWIPAKFAEVLSDKEVAFKGVAKTFVKGHANYAVAMLDADGKYTGKFLKQGSSFKVFAKKVINGHLCYRLGTQAQWVPARFLVF